MPFVQPAIAPASVDVPVRASDAATTWTLTPNWLSSKLVVSDSSDNFSFANIALGIYDISGITSIHTIASASADEADTGYIDIVPSNGRAPSAEVFCRLPVAESLTGGQIVEFTFSAFLREHLDYNASLGSVTAFAGQIQPTSVRFGLILSRNNVHQSVVYGDAVPYPGFWESSDYVVSADVGDNDQLLGLAMMFDFAVDHIVFSADVDDAYVRNTFTLSSFDFSIRVVDDSSGGFFQAILDAILGIVDFIGNIPGFLVSLILPTPDMLGPYLDGLTDRLLGANNFISQVLGRLSTILSDLIDAFDADFLPSFVEFDGFSINLHGVNDVFPDQDLSILPPIGIDYDTVLPILEPLHGVIGLLLGLIVYYNILHYLFMTGAEILSIIVSGDWTNPWRYWYALTSMPVGFALDAGYEAKPPTIS